jgi:transcriptional regulator with XRE-family HTH domain
MPRITPEQLSAILFALRERYTIRYLADVLSVTRPTIYNWVNQLSFPSYDRLRKVLYLARAAKIDARQELFPPKQQRCANAKWD